MKRAITIIPLIIMIVFTACAKKNEAGHYVGIAEGTVHNVSSLYGGKLVEIAVDEGDEIKAGQPVALLDTLDMNYKRLEIDAGYDQLAVQKQIYLNMKSQAEKDLAYVDTIEERTKSLLETQSVPQQKYDDVVNMRNKAQTQLLNAKQQLSLISAKKKELDAKLLTLEKRIADSSLNAPTNGIVTSVLFEVEETLPPVAPVVEITELDEIETTIYIPAEELPQTKVGQKMKIMADGVSQAMTGVVERIGQKAEFTPSQVLTKETRSALVYAVELRIENPDHLIKHGMPLEISRMD